MPLLSVVLQSSIHTCQSCKVIILHLATMYQLFAHIGERKVPSFMLFSSHIIVLFFLNFLCHPFSIVALRFNLETIVSPPLTEVLQVQKMVIWLSVIIKLYPYTWKYASRFLSMVALVFLHSSVLLLAPVWILIFHIAV